MAKEKDIKTKKQKSHYFKDMKAELKKVIWPTPKQLFNNTIAVIAFTLITAIIVFVLDVCFESINKYGVTALQEKVQSAYSSSNETENTDTNSTTTEGEETNSTDGNSTVEGEANSTEENSTVEEGTVTEQSNEAEAENTSSTTENAENANNEENTNNE